MSARRCRCGDEWATVLLRTELGETSVGPRCAAIVQALGELCGLEPQRVPLLKAVK